MKEFSFQADECLRKIAHDVCEEVNPEIRVLKEELLPEISLYVIRV